MLFQIRHNDHAYLTEKRGSQMATQYSNMATFDYIWRHHCDLLVPWRKTPACRLASKSDDSFRSAAKREIHDGGKLLRQTFTRALSSLSLGLSCLLCHITASYVHTSMCSMDLLEFFTHFFRFLLIGELCGGGGGISTQQLMYVGEN